jgi:polyisoprenoid-binding protein YceI
MATWKIDPDHSTISFRVKYLTLTAVTGYFTNFRAEVKSKSDDITAQPSIDFSAEVDSIQTNHPQRDKHLKSADFFDAGNYGQISFKATDFEQIGMIRHPFPIGPFQKSYSLEGDLTIRNITRPVTLKAEYTGEVTDQNKRIISGFTISGKLSRLEFGMNWGGRTEAGKIILSDEVRISCDLQFIRNS